jgi:hypothetical protein
MFANPQRLGITGGIGTIISHLWQFTYILFLVAWAFGGGHFYYDASVAYI